MILRLAQKHAKVLEIVMMNDLEISSFNTVEKLINKKSILKKFNRNKY